MDKILLMLGLFVSTPASSEQLFSYEENPQAWCLAQNIYYEARGSSYADQVAVANVVLNRVEDPRFPNTVCKVVRQGPTKKNGLPVKNKCQFSWYCDGKSDWAKDRTAWRKAQQLAHKTMRNRYDITEGATHYHAEYVNPYWKNSMDLIGRIGEHVYYRWN